MFMYSFRLKRTAVAIGGIILAIVLVMGVTGVFRSIGGGSVAADSTTPKSAGPVSSIKKVSGKTNDDRLSFIRSFGWEVEEDAAEIIEVIIPAEFDEVYTQYNAIQQKQGCNLKDYAGKRCKRYSYAVTNYPGTEQAVRINLLVYKNKIVGGDVCSLDANGFIHGFEAPQ